MNLKTLRTIWISCLVIIIIYLLWHSLVPLGHVTYSSDFSKDSFFIDRLLPAERVSDKRIIIDEPVYLAVYSPGVFNQAIVTINFVGPAPALQIGLEHNKELWLYDFKQIKEGSLSARLEFNLAGASRKKGKYTFMFSDPNLKTQKLPLVIKDVSVEFIKPAWFK